MSAICGGMLSKTEWMKDPSANMMFVYRERVKFRGKYRYKIHDPLGDRWWWEKKKAGGRT